MAKNLALLALLLCVASLFLPITQGLNGAITVGVLTGTQKNPAGAIMIAPAALAALFGVLIGRKGFGRGLGVLHLLFGVASVGLCSIIFTDERVGSGPMDVQVGLGAWMALGAGVLVTVAGLIGLIKPEKKA